MKDTGKDHGLKYLSSLNHLRGGPSKAEAVDFQEPGTADACLQGGKHTGPRISSILNSGTNWAALHKSFTSPSFLSRLLKRIFKSSSNVMMLRGYLALTLHLTNIYRFPHQCVGLCVKGWEARQIKQHMWLQGAVRLAGGPPRTL